MPVPGDTALGLDQPDGLGALFVVDIGDQHAGAAPRESLRGGPADTTPGSGDQSHLSVEFRHLRPPAS
ncbi:hypothetical protein SAMN05443573_10966 [Celeribacter indicus]|nr:hypothetical protein SAMN05443573_10966 [Celeribacter indicus]